ncbi:hypothetical protein C808_04023 [Lachnospiraceae bacterium M18-1]|nr:hypothetical protein C808_04023 [Lachnospiraceae bacterium M18-1]
MIRLYLPESMHEFICTHQTVHGRIRVHVKETETDFTYSIQTHFLFYGYKFIYKAESDH